MIKRVLSKLRRVTMSLFAVLCAGAVWGEEEATTPSTSALTIDPCAGYVLTGLGELGDQAAVVFTNSAEGVTCTWAPPKGLKNVEFLAVGGGGGGGGHYYNGTAKYCQGGAGGGGGAVVTGFIKNLASDATISVVVGAGGDKGIYGTDNGRAGHGGNSTISVGDATYITAYGGGGDGGKDSRGAANGGSNSGSRGVHYSSGTSLEATPLIEADYIGDGADVENVVCMRNKGGTPYETDSGAPGSGGGGAGGAGCPTYGGSSCGGTGGFGYVSFITGERVVYGAGGGGGLGKNGGSATYLEEDYLPFLEGAGLGEAGKDGTDGLANQGGGGGGGSYQKNGGEGGSGIVVLRFGYVTDPISVDINANILPKISDKPYTGTPLTSGLVDTYAYTVEELGERINFGKQTVRVTLNDDYVWADGDTNKSKEFTWNITQEVNNWKVEPYISHTTWPQDFTSTVNFKFTAPETSFGVLQAELSKDGAEPQPFSGALPNEPGSYTLRYWVEETSNWAAKEWTQNFKIYRSEAFDEGYKVYGLGEKGDEVAVVFTKSGTWTVPANLKSAQFLVVGGGGGGGAEANKGDGTNPGAGGGGGGVVTGFANFAKGQEITVTVGAGGNGGKAETNYKGGGTANGWGASYAGGASKFGVGTTSWVTANGGGRDQGTTSISSTAGRTGSVGGSGGGGRPTKNEYTTVATSKGGSVASSIDNIISYTSYAKRGGKSTVKYAGAGGGGATTVGSNPTDGNSPGNGGIGLYSDITGARLCYGSGGGGGCSTTVNDYAEGGPGAGDGNRTRDTNGINALANQGGGGGGGGGGWKSNGTDMGANGGNGGSGIVVFRYSVYEAEVTTTEGSTSYATLAEAFAAAGDGATVKLLNDAELAEKVTIKTALTLDLNGCTLSETCDNDDAYGAFYVGTAGNFTITDSATLGAIVTDGGVVVGNYGTVTVNGGTIEAGDDSANDASIYNFYYNGSTYGKATINGGSIGRIWNCGTANITAGTVGDIDNSGAMTIAEEAVIEDEEIILGNDAADVPNAGTIITTKELSVKTLVDDYTVENVDGVYKLKYSKTYTVTLPAAPANTVWYYNGQAVTGPIYAEYGSDVTITLKPAQDCFFGDGSDELTVVTISGIAEDTTVSLDNVAVEVFQVVARIGDTPYASLQAAYAAAEAESTIVLRKDVTGAGLVIDKSVTIDFGGNTYTFNDGVGNVPSNGFQILNGNTVTLKNGELNVDAASADKFYTLIQNYANLTVEDMVLDGTNLDKWSKTDGDSYVLSNNSGTVVVAGATSIIANDEGALAYAFDVCKYKTYAIPTVTLNTTGTISGKVEVSGGDFVYEAGTIEDAIVFTSGSVKGEVEDALTIPEDKVLSEDANGAFILVDKTYAAQVGEEKFETFAAALAASNGNAITLLADVVTDFEVAGAVEINLNGYDVKATVTLAQAESALTVGAELSNATFVACLGYGVSYADGVYSLAKVNVAMIGEVSYGTLQEALEAAAADAVVKLIASTEENITIRAEFAGTIDLGGYTLKGRIDSYANGAVLKNGSIIHDKGSKAAVQIEAGSLELTDINLESNYHGVRLNGANTTATINSGTYRITSNAGTYNLVYATGANTKFYVYGGEYYNMNDTYVLKANADGSEINVYGGTFNGGIDTTFQNNGGKGIIKVFGGTFVKRNPADADSQASVQPGYKVEGTGPWTVVPAWTAPMPEQDGEAGFELEYTDDVIATLQAEAATSVSVKVNGETLKGDKAVAALNTAVKCFDGALTFNGTAASVDIVIEVTEVNTEDPAASTVVVKRGETVLSVKTGVKPTIKYFYPDTKEWKADKPESGAVLFKIVF